MSIRDAYDSWSATYDADRNLTRDLDQTVTRDLLSDLHFETILEIGCGTGKNTPLLARIGRQVHAVDFSEGMIQRARDKSPFKNVTFVVADLTKRWPYADRSANLAVCNLVLEHIEDLSFPFSEAHRLLAKGGRFLVCELHPFRQYLGSKATFQKNEQKTEIPAFVHHVSDFVTAAQVAGFTLTKLMEWWHQEDQRKPPRLVSFLFQR